MTTNFQLQEPIRSDVGAISAGTPEQQRAETASHLAHDVRNWLTVLQMYCDLLSSSGAVSVDGRVWVESLSNAVEQGHGLVTSLLDFTLSSTSPSSSSEDEAGHGVRIDTGVCEPPGALST